MSYKNLLNLEKVHKQYLDKKSKDKKHRPGTVKSYLLSLTHFIDFLSRSIVHPKAPHVVNVAPELTIEHLHILNTEVSKWRESLKGEIRQREMEVMCEDGDKVITREEFQNALKSDYCIAVRKYMRKIGENFKENPKGYVTKRDTLTSSRDVLFLTL